MKFLVIGDPGVGKSTLIRHISDENSFSSLPQEKNFWSCKAFNQKLGLFEVSTLEKPCAGSLALYKDIDGIIFLFSLNDACTSPDLLEWIESSKAIVPRFLVGNKKSSEKNVDLQELYQLPYFEVNALEKIEVECLFSTLIQRIKMFKVQNFAFQHEISSWIKNTDEEMAKKQKDIAGRISFNDDDIKVFKEEILNEIVKIKTENKEILKKINSSNKDDEITRFRFQAQSALDEFRKEGKALIDETQEFLVQIQSLSKESSENRPVVLKSSSAKLNKSKSVKLDDLGLNKERISEIAKENIPQVINPPFLEKSKSICDPENEFSLQREIRLVWDAINTIVGNTHDHLEKIRMEIKALKPHHNLHVDEVHQIKAQKSFIEKEMPHIITRVKDQVHNQIIDVQKEFEDKIIILEDNFLNNCHNFLQNLHEHKNETEHYLKEKTDEIRKSLLDEKEISLVLVENALQNMNNFEESIQSLQSPFLRMQKDDFEKNKPKQSNPPGLLQYDMNMIKEVSLPSLWSTLNLIANRLDRLEQPSAFDLHSVSSALN